jgi:hypothetical protein
MGRLLDSVCPLSDWQGGQKYTSFFSRRQEGRKAFSVDREGKNDANFIQVGHSERSRISRSVHQSGYSLFMSHVFPRVNFFIDPKIRSGDSIPLVSRSADTLSPYRDFLPPDHP